MLYRYAQDGMFVENVNSLDSDAAWLQFTQGQAAFTYVHSGRIGDYLDGDFPELELGLIPPLIGVDDPAILRQMPGGTGNALCLYTDSAEDRREVLTGIMDAMTSDPVIEALNEENGDPASCNVNVNASDSALATTYAETCAPNQVTYLDWSWPPEITRAFQENQQALVSGDSDPESAADAIQQVLEDLYLDGYQFAT